MQQDMCNLTSLQTTHFNHLRRIPLYITALSATAPPKSCFVLDLRDTRWWRRTLPLSSTSPHIGAQFPKYLYQATPAYPPCSSPQATPAPPQPNSRHENLRSCHDRAERVLRLGGRGFKEVREVAPNGGNVPNVPAIGHTDGTGDDEATNAFGDAFAEADYAWTKELCEADSDGDGQTNGQELRDPCCVWSVGGTPLWTSGVSNPGDAASTSDPSLWASACGASTTETSETSEPTTSESITAPTAGSTDSDLTGMESTDDSHGVGAPSSTNTTSSGHASTSTTGAEKCASDLASTRALRASN